MIITENCGTCDHSTGKTKVLCHCTRVNVDVVKDTLEQGCPFYKSLTPYLQSMGVSSLAILRGKQ